jgi:AmmeMemoRadiSam system protein A
MFTVKEKQILLLIAREAIKSEFDETDLNLSAFEKDFPQLSKIKTGAFVTLHMNGELRGCIGFIYSNNNLIKTIADAAVLAAFQDYRFLPLSKEEFDKIKIEISVLSEPQKISSYDEIVIGKHGLIVEEEGKRGLLLPQVATEYNMNLEEFLTAICRKANLSPYLWQKKQINLQVFTVEYFSED